MALPEIRELLFADLPPLTAIETYAAVADLHNLALAAAREDESGARDILARVVEGATESRVRLQAWSLARRVGIEPPPDDAQARARVVVDVGFDAGIDTLAAYVDGTARYLNQAGGGIVWETADETIGASIEALIQAGQEVAERMTSSTVRGRPRHRPAEPRSGSSPTAGSTSVQAHSGRWRRIRSAGNRRGDRLMRLLIARSATAQS